MHLTSPLKYGLILSSYRSTIHNEIHSVAVTDGALIWPLLFITPMSSLGRGFPMVIRASSTWEVTLSHQENISLFLIWQ